MRSFRTIALVALSAFALAAPAHADVKAGVEAWQKGDYQGAVAQWRPLAVAGDADAQFNLGQAYKLGRGVPADLAQAELWYRRAAKQGHLQAEDNLGLILFTANRRDEAMPYIVRSAARGEPRAQYVLGTAMYNGDFAAKNWPRAYALTKRASDAGLEIASARLSQLDMLIPLEQRQAGLAMLPQMEKDEARARLDAVNAAAPPPPKPAPSPIRTASLPPSVPGASYTPPPVIAPAPAPAPAPVIARPLPAPVATPAPAPTPVLSSPAAMSAASAAAEATAAAETAKASAPAPVAAAEPATPGASYAAPPESGDLPPQATPAPVAPQPVAIAEAAPAPAPVETAPPPAAEPAHAAPVRSVAASPWRAQLGAFGVEANARNLWRALERKYPAFAERQPYLVTGKLTRLQVGDFANKAGAESFCATVRKGGQACLVVDR